MKYLSQRQIASTSITPTFQGAPIDCSQLLSISVQAVIAGGTSPSGSIQIQASNDVCTAGNNPGTFVPTNWADITGATIPYTTNSTVMIPKLDICYRWVRVVNTFTSGTGNISVNIFGISV
jgi:hypothetical protein